MSNDEPSLKQLTKLDQIQIESPTKFESFPKRQSQQKQENQVRTNPNPHHIQSQRQHHHHHQNCLYQQTYYLTGLRQNYLVMISDNMHIIQLPVGLLKGNVAIGDPIKLKLELDAKRANADKRKFYSLQEELIKQYTQEQH